MDKSVIFALLACLTAVSQLKPFPVLAFQQQRVLMEKISFERRGDPRQLINLQSDLLFSLTLRNGLHTFFSTQSVLTHINITKG